MMRVLVTGAGGQVGWEVVRQGMERGFTVMSMSRERLDISDEDAVLKVLDEQRPAVVINAAAYTKVDRAETEVELAMAVNHHGAVNLARGCSELDIPLLHISTDYVFDGTKVGAYSEDDPVNPLGVYGRSKLAGDDAIRSLCEKHLILRVSWVFGFMGHNFVKTMLRLGRERVELGIVHDQRGGPTAAADIADAVLRMALAVVLFGNRSWGVYNFSGVPTVSWFEFAAEIFSQVAEFQTVPRLRPITSDQYPLPVPRPANSELDCGKIANVFGIVRPDWRVGLRNCLGMLRNNQ